MPKAEKQHFDMHPQFIMDAITRQAGSLWKAVLEGIMNSIDAGATRVDITMDKDKINISDDGRGFRSRKEIDEWFKVFGTPHSEAEGKRYGRFRMGRGQGFAYGANIWRAGKFRMFVDIAKHGLKFDLETLKANHPGCDIDIDLYKSLSHVQLDETVRDLKFNAKFAPTPLFINGEQVNVDISRESWDYETEEADIRLRERGDLVIYNQGIRVMSLHNSRLGTGGDVVTKKALRVNFARNDIMSDCPIWKNIKKLLDTRSTERNVNAPRLTDEIRQRLCTQIANADNVDTEEVAAARAAVLARETLKIFADVRGRKWSYRQIVRQFKGRIAIAPRDHDERGDSLMQHKVCFVASPDLLVWFNNAASLQDVIAIYEGHGSRDLAYISYAEKAATIDAHKTAVPKEKWTAVERVVINILTRMQGWLLWNYPTGHSAAPTQRHLMVGLTDSANAWTDGSTYIAINRKYIKQIGLSGGAWVNYGSLLVHEYCHDEPNTHTHVHSPEFYELYHDWTRSNDFGNFAYQALRDVPRGHKAESKRIAKAALSQQDAADRTEKEVEKILAK